MHRTESNSQILALCNYRNDFYQIAITCFNILSGKINDFHVVDESSLWKMWEFFSFNQPAWIKPRTVVLNLWVNPPNQLL